ncbi:cell division cycle protein 123-like [Pelomyxa schiedti]|nr:cell division cycle protein 123-like [Pelomyxa schiedti]
MNSLLYYSVLPSTSVDISSSPSPPFFESMSHDSRLRTLPICLQEMCLGVPCRVNNGDTEEVVFYNTRVATEAASAVQIDDGFNVDAWAGPLASAGLTAKTGFVELSEHHALCLLRAYERYHGICKHPGEKEDARDLKQLASILTHGIQSISRSGVFVRLGSRSPKDAAMQSQKMRDLLGEYLALGSHSVPCLHGIGEGVSSAARQNFEFYAYFAAQIASLRCTNGGQAVELLAKSTRVYEDLGRELKCSAIHTWGVKIALREWNSMPISYEFRGFVCRKRLCALSQYFDMIYFPPVAQNKDAIAQRIQLFFNNILLPLLPFDDGVVDFLADPDRPEVCVIEMNPFTRFTSACMFNWKTDIDILEGRQPFEIRVVKAPLPVDRERESDSTTGRLEWLSTTAMVADQDLLAEHGDILKMAAEVVTDPFERINNCVSYALKHRMYRHLT